MHQEVNSDMRYVGLEIVSLKQDHPNENLKAGDCGVVWGVYGSGPSPYSYEATFINKQGEASDVMFEEAEVEEVQPEDVAHTAHPEWLLATVQTIRRFEKML